MIYQGDCLTILPTLPADSVQCVVTSPPYFGLRDYGTATWEGGSAECDHTTSTLGGIRNAGRDRAASGGKFHDSPNMEPALAIPFRHLCGKCGARRLDAQLGLEDTPAAYVEKMVAVFREVRRVLRPDGVVFLNLGDSMSTGEGADVANCLNRLLESSLVFYARADAVAVSGHSIDVAPQDQGFPDGKLTSLLASEWERIKDRHNDFGNVLHLLATPRDSGLTPESCFVPTDVTRADVTMKVFDEVCVISAQHNTDSDPEFGVLRAMGAWPLKHHKATLAVNQAGEPSAKGCICWHTAWDSFAGHATFKSVPNVHMMNDAIPLGNGFHTFAGAVRDFSVAEASEKQVTFRAIASGMEFRVSDVRQLRFLLSDGSIVPYTTVYTSATRMANRERAKQEMGIPNAVKVALQEDGWICRQTIIWAKPNPMPESVTDRCTKAHEYIFLLTRSERYYYDAEAINQPAEPSTISRCQYNRVSTKGRAGFEQGGNYVDPKHEYAHRQRQIESGTRNRRSVWTIATEPYADAHFATFPTKIPKLCILAGTKPGDTVMDPFAGSGTTGMVAHQLGREFIGIELNPEYVALAEKRIAPAKSQGILPETV